MKLRLHAARAQLQSAETRGGRLLLVDDEQENLDGLEALLSQAHFIWTTTDPYEAIEIFRREEIDLVISDQRMPKLSGTELFRHLQREESARSHSCILLTGYTDLHDLIRCVNERLIYRYLVKPWDPSELRATIRQALELLQTERSLKLQTERLAREVEERRRAQLQLQETLDELQRLYRERLAQQRLRSLGEMVSGVAHDFNNLLFPILSYSDLMLSALRDGQIETGELIENLQVIHQAARDGTQLLRRLKASYQPGVKRSPHGDISVEALIRDALALSLPRWCRKGQAEPETLTPTPTTLRLPFAQGQRLPESFSVDEQLRVSIERCDGLRASLDASEIRQALVNLICNALDAMEGRPESRLQITAQETDGALHISVRDNGAGMDAETVERCREPFFTTKGARGTGLGIVMVQQALSRHGGHLEIQSTLGVGTSITMSFPPTHGGAEGQARGQLTLDDRTPLLSPAAPPSAALRSSSGMSSDEKMSPERERDR